MSFWAFGLYFSTVYIARKQLLTNRIEGAEIILKWEYSWHPTYVTDIRIMRERYMHLVVHFQYGVPKGATVSLYE